MNTPKPISPDAACRRYNLTIFAAMAVYVVVLLACVYELKHTPPGPWRAVLALLPTMPVFWAMWSVIVYLRHTDELQRRIFVDALAIAAGVIGALALTYGFLEDFAGFAHVPAWWGFVIMDFVWGASVCVLRLRYR